MATTILEALQNAEYNLKNPSAASLFVAKEQLHNAITLLEKGFSLDEEIDQFLYIYAKIEDVPDAETLKALSPKGEKYNDDSGV